MWGEGGCAWENKFLSRPDLGAAAKLALVHFRANIKCKNSLESRYPGRKYQNIFATIFLAANGSVSLLKKVRLKFHS